MKKNSFKSAFSELYLISPVVYKAVIENIKKSGGDQLKELEKLNKNYLINGDRSVLEQPTNLTSPTQPANTDTNTQISPETSNIDTQTMLNPIIDPTLSQRDSLVDGFSQTNQMNMDQHNQTTQTTPSVSSISSQTDPKPEMTLATTQTVQPTKSVSSISSQTNPKPEMNLASTQTVQPLKQTNTTQTTLQVPQFSESTQSSTSPSIITPSPIKTKDLTVEKSLDDLKKIYKCDYCSSGFTRLFSKQRHVKNIHGSIKKNVTRKRKAEGIISSLPAKESKIEKFTKIKSRIPRPKDGIIALAKNKNVVKRSITQGNSKIPRLIKRKIFKDEPGNVSNSKLKRKKIVESQNSETQPKANTSNRGIKRKKEDQLQNHSKKRKTFPNWK